MLKADSNALAPVKDEAGLGCTGILPVGGPPRATRARPRSSHRIAERIIADKSVIRTMTASGFVRQSRNNNCEQMWSDLTVLAAAV
jgi:hypothetical protein